MYFKSCRLQCGGHACEVELILLVGEHMLRSSDSQDSALWALQCSWEDMVWEREGGRRRKEIAPPGWFTSFLLFYQFYFLGQIFLHFVCEAINSHSRTFGTPRYFGKSGEPVFSIPAVSLFFVSSPHSGYSALALPSLSQTGFQELQERVQSSQIF